MSTTPETKHARPKWLGLALSVILLGCANTSDADSGEEVPAADSGAALEGEVSCQPDYSAEELAALAESEEVQRRRFPFAPGPEADRSLHVTMADGVRIAVDLYYPPDFDPDAAARPSVYTETWYGRAEERRGMAVDLYRQAGFVVAIADPRGMGASFGSQSSYLTEAQRSDQREMIAWLAAQPWSNGQVTTVGVSVSAMLAEAMLASGAPNLEAGIVRATELDQYSENLFPGGIPNGRIHELISSVLFLHRAEPCLADPAACGPFGLDPVDGDEDLTLLHQALAEHQANVPMDALSGVTYSDDAVGSDHFDDVSPRGHLEQLAQAALPVRLTASWTDGTTAQAALERWAALPDAPMQVSIGAITHLGGLDTDPFSHDAFAPARTSPVEQFGADVDFLTQALAGEKIERRIDYYVFGADAWKKSAVWPPHGVADHTLHLSHDGLSARAPREAGERDYAVDPEASSGAAYNRWASQSNEPVYYGDRRFAQGERASFDGEPLAEDTELVGAPELCLALKSDQKDGAVFAYLEDVAPDGRVTYLTEGLLRLLHRGSGGCDAAHGTERSFSRADAAEVVPGEAMQIELPFLPVAARIQKGHRLRLSLAGADAGTFPLLSDAPAHWSIGYGGNQGSSLILPSRPWSERD